MTWTRKCDLLVVSALSFGSAVLPAQTQLKLENEIRLPISTRRGTFGGGLFRGYTHSNEVFALHIAPDQSLLILNADANGKWPLVRLRQWWSKDVRSEVLYVPGWDAAGNKYLDDVHADLEITPDGRYAVAILPAVWPVKGDGELLPKSYVTQKPDTIVAVIDLKRWEIVKSVHTTDFMDMDMGGATVAGERTLVVQGMENLAGADRIHSRKTQLVLLPDLVLGAACTSDRGEPLGRPPQAAALESLARRNDAACHEVLEQTGFTSVEQMDYEIYLKHDEEPDELLLKRAYSVPGEDSEREMLWRVRSGEKLEDFDNWDGLVTQFYAENPPFQASSGTWYEFYGAKQKGFYELGKFDARGNLRDSRTIRQMACGDPLLEGKHSTCGCRIDDVSESQNVVLSYCRTQFADFTGHVQREWVTAFRADDLSELGLAALDKGKWTEQKIAAGDGSAHVIVLEGGDVVRVFGIPGPP